MKQFNKKTTPVKKSSVKKKAEQPAVVSAALLGDEPLLQEYAKLFEENRITVFFEKSLPANTKKITYAFELTTADAGTKKKHLQLFEKLLSPETPIISSSITQTLLEQMQWMQHKERLVGIGAFPTLIENSAVELTTTFHTKSEIADAVQNFFAAIKKEACFVQDSVGMVMPRILCQVINEAMFAVQYGIAQPKDIDEAMKLAMQFPLGPIEWGEKIGFKNIVDVLDALHSFTKEERYKVSPLLRRISLAGVFWNSHSSR